MAMLIQIVAPIMRPQRWLDARSDCGQSNACLHRVTKWRTLLRANWLLPAVLSTTAGAVDVIGFLALGGLFTAHITGNLVIVAAHYATGGFSQIGPLLSVPVFMVVMGLVTLASSAIARAGSYPLRPLLLLQTALLAGFLLLGA